MLQVEPDQQGQKESPGHKDQRAHKEHKDQRAHKEHKDQRAHKEHKELLVIVFGHNQVVILIIAVATWASAQTPVIN